MLAVSIEQNLSTLANLPDRVPADSREQVSRDHNSLAILQQDTGRFVGIFFAASWFIRSSLQRLTRFVISDPRVTKIVAANGDAG
jgi:hypothetical protein